MVLLKQAPPCVPLRAKPGAAHQACAEELRHCAAELLKVAKAAVVQRGSTFVFQPQWDRSFEDSFRQA